MKAAVTPTRVPVLVVSPYPEDHIQLGKILQRDCWELRHATTCEQAQALLEKSPFALVISESDATGMCWRRMLSVIEKLVSVRKPELVVISSKADERLWSEVLNLGGYNVLAKPFDPIEVRWVLENAAFESARMEPVLTVAASHRYMTGAA